MTVFSTAVSTLNAKIPTFSEIEEFLKGALKPDIIKYYQCANVTVNQVRTAMYLISQNRLKSLML